MRLARSRLYFLDSADARWRLNVAQVSLASASGADRNPVGRLSKLLAEDWRCHRQQVFAPSRTRTSAVLNWEPLWGMAWGRVRALSVMGSFG